MSLPGKQDELVRAVAAANRNTIVVLETGGPVLMPWIEDVSAVLEAWFPGIRGGEAIAGILFGDVNPSGKLPLTFARSETDLAHVTVQGPPVKGSRAPFDIKYTEGLKVGYKWFDAENKEPLFPFGLGLSYTTYSYSGLHVAQDKEDVRVTFGVKNTGGRAGAEIAQVYVSLPASAGEPPRRLVAWQKIPLDPGEAKMVTLALDPRDLSIFDANKNGWTLVPGQYGVFVGGSSRDTPLSGTFSEK
jgi:beta-glucosidase